MSLRRAAVGFFLLVSSAGCASSFERGKAALDKGEYSASISHFNEAARDRSAESAYYRGLAYLHLGNDQLALAEYQLAVSTDASLRLRPDYTKLCVEQGRRLLERGEDEAALAKAKLGRTIDSRDSESFTLGIEALLHMAERFKKAGRIKEAFGAAIGALESSEEVKRDDLVAKARPVADGLRDPYSDFVVGAVRDLLGKGDAESALQACAVLEKHMLPSRKASAAALRAEVEEKARALAASLVEQAAKGKTCFDVEPLLKRATALDPKNEKIKAAYEAVAKLCEENTPAYVKDLHVQEEGDGWLVWFTVANKAGDLVPAPGKATIEFVYQHYGRTSQQCGYITKDVAAQDYQIKRAGIAGDKLMFIFPRVAHDDVKVFGLPYSHPQAQELCLSEKVRNNGRFGVVLTLDPTFGKQLQTFKEIH